MRRLATLPPWRFALGPPRVDARLDFAPARLAASRVTVGVGGEVQVILETEFSGPPVTAN